MPRMTDFVDDANDLIDLATHVAISNALNDRYHNVSITEIIDPITHKLIRICSDCDELIPQSRLDVLPNAALCVDCQNIREIKK